MKPPVKTPLARWMEHAGETDETLSPKVGVSRVQISRIRRDKSKPSPATAVKLEAITKLPASIFIFGDAA